MSEETENKAVGLTDEETAQVTGGMGPFIPDLFDFYLCPLCYARVTYPHGGKKPNCKCGYNPYTGQVDPPSGGTPTAVDVR